MSIYDLKINRKTQKIGVPAGRAAFSFLADEAGTFTALLFLEESADGAFAGAADGAFAANSSGALANADSGLNGAANDAANVTAGTENTMSGAPDDSATFIKVAETAVKTKDAGCFYFDTDLMPGRRYVYTVEGKAGTRGKELHADTGNANRCGLPSAALRADAPAAELCAEFRFETAIPLDAPFITPKDKNIFSPVLKRTFFVERLPKNARLAITGLGLFRAFLNGNRVGRDYLTPGFNDYDAYLRYYTYDVTGLLTEGENTLAVFLGDGWYKGRFGIDKPVEAGDKVFGDKYLLSAKLYTFDAAFRKADGEEGNASPSVPFISLLETDEKWTAAPAFSTFNNIYDGETDDFSRAPGKESPCVLSDEGYRLVPAFGAEIREIMTLKPVLYLSPKGERILDFGQNAAGFVRVKLHAPRGTKVTLTHGEVLQNGCFYNANYRTAKAEATYISDGTEREAEPFFTYFGFRYVKVEGLDEVNPDDFTFVVLSSALEKTSDWHSDSEEIDRLVKNAYFGQLSNFLDVPTDCPQRDERLGWTADAQVFSRTACYQEDCFAMYDKFMTDLRADQTAYFSGDVPMYSPSLKREAGNGGAVWADAATILPQNVYLFYGDKELLQKNYPMMKDYADLLISRAEKQGRGGLILSGFTFGDWLAQDGVCPQALAGGTDNGFIMSVYCYHSLTLAADAAKTLARSRDEKKYRAYAEKVRTAILGEYFSSSGRLALDTQTAYVLSLYFGIYVDRARIVEGFRARLEKDFYRMKTGFCGTPLLLPALLSSGMEEEAFRILFSEDCPGWLYQIRLGATTVWERWNSLLADGTISGTNMNSLNHYAYGTVAEALYGYVAGLRPLEPGWKTALVQPHFNYRLKKIDFSYRSPVGIYAVSYRMGKDGCVRAEITVPAGGEVVLRLPGSREERLTAGVYVRHTPKNNALVHPFSLKTPNLDVIKNPEGRRALQEILPRSYAFVTGENPEFLIKNGEFLGSLPMFGATKADLERYEKALRQIEP